MLEKFYSFSGQFARRLFYLPSLANGPTDNPALAETSGAICSVVYATREVLGVGHGRGVGGFLVETITVKRSTSARVGQVSCRLPTKGV